jgi:OOP family OmpA-OmpF porin
LIALGAAALLAVAPAFGGDAVFGVDAGHTKVSDTDIKGSGLGVYGGYRFNDSYAVEFGYRRLFSETTNMFGPPVKITGSTLQASVLGYLPLGNDFSLFARIGYGQLKAKATVAGSSADDSEGKTLFGLGAEYAFSKSTALRLEWQKPASDTTTWSLGLKFSF